MTNPHHPPLTPRRLLPRLLIGIAVTLLAFTSIKDSAPIAHHLHVCPAGAKDYDPGHATPSRRPGAGYELTLTVPPEGWYDPTQLPPRDRKDWLKAGGVSYYDFWKPGTWPKNRRSALVGFRMFADRQWQACAYVNDAEGGFTYGATTTLAVGDTLRVRCTIDDGLVNYTLTTDEGRQTATFEDFTDAPRWTAVGPWHGGSVAAPERTTLFARMAWGE